MGIRTFTRIALAFSFLFVGALFLNTGTANAVADLNISVNDGGQTLGGATVSLTFPDGSTQTYTDDDNDGRIGIVLNDPGRYRMTITTKDGVARSTSFNAPANGGVMVDYDVSAGSPRVTVNDSSGTSRSASPWSWGLYGTLGFTNWQGQEDSGSGFQDGNKENMTKYGFGGGLRYEMPNFPMFLAANFFYHAGKSDRIRSGSSSFDLIMRERWRAQFLAGWVFHSTDNLSLALIAGITLARLRMDLFQSSSFQNREKKITVNPTFGAEASWRLQNARDMFFVIGMTATIMSAITHDTGSSQMIRADGKVQWDTYMGFRMPF